MDQVVPQIMPCTTCAHLVDYSEGKGLPYDDHEIIIGIETRTDQADVDMLPAVNMQPARMSAYQVMSNLHKRDQLPVSRSLTNVSLSHY